MLIHRLVLASALALALAAPASAGSLAIVATIGSNECPTVTAPPGGTTSPPKCIAGSDAQLARIIDAYAARSGLDPAIATNAEKFNAFARLLFGEVKAAAANYEQEAARRAAEAGAAPVDMQ